MNKEITESQIQKSIIQYLDYLTSIKRLFYFRLNAGKVRKGNRWIKLAPKNSPDLLVLIPYKIKEEGLNLTRLISIGFEIKRPYKSEWTEGQIRFAIDFETLGGKYYKITCFEDFKQILDDWLKRGGNAWSETQMQKYINETKSKPPSIKQ